MSCTKLAPVHGGCSLYAKGHKEVSTASDNDKNKRNGMRDCGIPDGGSLVKISSIVEDSICI